MRAKALYLSLVGLGVAAGLAALPVLHSGAQQVAAVQIDADDIGGIVTGARGPEAGVWVVAESKDFGTRYAKVVVTDDQGRFVVPDLPKGTYQVWVRGYGLVDSAKVTSEPGKLVNITATAAPTPAAAAQIYPAIYWYSLLEIPDKSQFPGTGTNGIATTVASQGQWLDQVKTNGCITCHQLGGLATRTLDPKLGHFDTSLEAWVRRIQSGQAGGNMVNAANRNGIEGFVGNFAKWTDAIAGGALPTAQPPRPAGMERNVVVTVWDWASPTTYLHDEIATDKRYPTVNAWGKLYGAPELSTDRVPVLDPVKNVATFVTAPVRDKDTPTTNTDPVVAPSIYWGTQAIWDSQGNMHNPMMDEQGRVWMTERIRVAANPAFCKAGSNNPFAKVFPVDTSGRQLSVYDPKTDKWALIDTCFGTHHLQFAFDANNTLWTSGGGNVVGWLNTKMFLETGDAEKSQGWTPVVVDTMGKGKCDAFVEPNQPTDPNKCKRINAGFYAVMPNPADNSIWGAVNGYPGAVVRLAPGPDLYKTPIAEYFAVPAPYYGVRGGDIDSNGIAYVSLSSGHLGAFDRRKCKGTLSGPGAELGHLCDEGWTFYQLPGPGFKGIGDNSAEASYWTWVDQHNTLGLGENVPIVTGNESDALFALVNGKFVTLRLPYPIGFFAKGVDGRIDDPAMGWKGRGLWTTSGNRTPQHIEGGGGTKPLALHFQVRPDPLAK